LIAAFGEREGFDVTGDEIFLMAQIDKRPLADILPADVKKFITSNIIVGDMPLPCHYPRLDGLDAWQAGFRFHANSGEDLVSTASGAWQPGWYVIALNYFDDPFFIDINEAEQGFPVYYAPHGAGRWEATRVAPNLQRFGFLLSALRGLADRDVQFVELIEAETETTNRLWHEVITHRRDRNSLEAEFEQYETEYDSRNLVHGTLVITDIGTQKIKVVQLLRKVLDLPLQQAMALATERDVIAGVGPLIKLSHIRDNLVALGASVEFRPIPSESQKS
jgi:hypothetical protein